MAENFVPNPVFAGRSIKFWAQFTKEELMNDWGLNERQIPLLEEQLVHIELKLKEAPKVEEGSKPVVFPRKATWRNQDADVPVVLTGDAGKAADGKEYYTVEGSDTAIPKDEVTLAVESESKTSTETAEKPKKPAKPKT